MVLRAHKFPILPLKVMRWATVAHLFQELFLSDIGHASYAKSSGQKQIEYGHVGE